MKEEKKKTKEAAECQEGKKKSSLIGSNIVKTPRKDQEKRKCKRKSKTWKSADIHRSLMDKKESIMGRTKPRE